MITCNLLPFTKTITCAVSGHRVVSGDFDNEKLKNELAQIVESGYEIFLTGMAKGFDTLCFKALVSLKKDYPQIKICAVIPCADQSKYYSLKEKAEYNQLLNCADFIAREERSYFKGCMLLRNNFLIENSSLLYAYFNGEKKGGTYYTVKKAKENYLEVKFYGESK